MTWRFSTFTRSNERTKRAPHKAVDQLASPKQILFLRIDHPGSPEPFSKAQERFLRIEAVFPRPWSVAKLPTEPAEVCFGADSELSMRRFCTPGGSCREKQLEAKFNGS